MSAIIGLYLDGKEETGMREDENKHEGGRDQRYIFIKFWKPTFFIRVGIHNNVTLSSLKFRTNDFSQLLLIS